MHLLIIHQYFLRPGEGGGARFNELSRRWADAGHQVTVLAGQVHYATGFKPEAERARLVVTHHHDGARVLRAFTPGTFRRSMLDRALALGAFGLSAIAAAEVAVDWDSVDVVLASSPSLIVAVPALWARVVRGLPVIFEVRDLWPESAITTGVIGPSGLSARALYALEAQMCRRASWINAVTPAIAADLLRRGLATSDRLSVIPNGADLELFARPLPPRQHTRARLGWADDELIALYVGAHGLANHLDQLIELAHLASTRAPGLRIVALGDGPERAGLIARTPPHLLQSGALTWHPPVPREAIPQWLDAADVGLVVLRDVPTFRTVYPNKLFDVMAAGRPLVSNVLGDAQALIADADAGLTVPPEDPHAMLTALLTLRDDPARREAMGERGRAFVRERFSREVAASRYLEVMGWLVQPRRASPP